MKTRFLSGIIAVAFALNTIGVLPANALAVDSETYTYEKDDYTVTYTVGSEWENNRSIEVTIENTGEESILNWALKYDVGGEVNNLWNSKIYESTEDYTIIKNNGYNYEIEPGSSANYGYIVTGAETLIPEDIELCSRRIDVKSGYDVDFAVTNDWYTGFNGEITVTNTSAEPIEAWTLTVVGNYDITNVWNAKLLSQNEHTYEFANQLWTTPINPGESAVFGFTADKSATENAAAENFCLTAVVVGDTTLDDVPAEEIDYELDSDSDGLPDYYEDILGTDKNNTDTDSDGLSDGYEVFYLGTDPLKADSDDNGVNDGEEDFDKDGLTNAEESELGTNPNCADTDGDGLNDGAEKNTHRTDPLKFDSDDDGISDGDEIALGLDPNSSSTDGTPDSERTFAQTIDAESEVLSVINDDESVPFDVSLEIEAAGVAKNNLAAYISGYSAVMRNDAVIGAVPEFSYSNGLTVESVTIKFELDDSVVANTSGKYADNAELSGIRRLNIFKYFDDIDMLLPVETFCNENDNTVYCITDSLGTYCLMDMELWIESLTEENLSETEVNESNAASAYSDEMIKAEVKVSNAASNAPDDFTVVFVLDCRSEKTASEFALMKEEILDVSRAVFQRSPNAKIYLMKQSTSLTDGVNYSFVSNGSKNYFNDYDSIKTRIKSVLKRPVLNAVLSDAVEGVVTECNLSKHTFVFSIFDEENVLYRSKSGYEALDKAIAYNVDISVISNISDDKKYGYAHDMYNKTKGIYISDTVGYAEKVLEHIYGEAVSIPDDDNGEYNIILATGLRTVELDDTVTHIYADRNKSEELQVDTDKDGLTDYKEINFGCNLIKFENGIVTLPTYGACVDYKAELTYVERGLNRFGDVIISDKSFLDYVYETVRVLPIVSDPTSEDGDGDTVPDDVDIDPLVPYLIVSDCIYHTDITHSVSKHALVNGYDESGIPVYVCVNCCEMFIDPEYEDYEKLNEQQFALVKSLQLCAYELENSNEVNSQETINSLISIYSIIDKIRETVVANNVTFYDYADDVYDENNKFVGRHYVSPKSKSIKDKNPYNLYVDIDITQITRDELINRIYYDYNKEFLTTTLITNSPIWWGINLIYPTYCVYDSIKSQSYTISDDLTNLGIAIVDNVVISSFLGIPYPLSISNVIAVNNYINKQGELNAIAQNKHIYHNMFYVIIKIQHPNKSVCFKNTIFFDGVKSSCLTQTWRDECEEVYISEKSNTFYINNNTDRQLIYTNYRVDF